MANPDGSVMEKAQRLARYLIGKPRVLLWYPYQDEPTTIDGYTDSDWAGCKRTRRSTSGGCLRHGSHLIKTWSRTQAVTALSSAEAELYGAVKTSAEVLGAISTWKYFGMDIMGNVLGDANAAIGIIKRAGLGKLRHLNTQWLWVQEKHARNKLHYGKVAGAVNWADLLTKHLDQSKIEQLSEGLGMEFRTDKSEIGLEIHHVGIDMSSVSRAIEVKYGPMLKKLKAWTRIDEEASAYKSTNHGGPEWSTVKFRVIANAMDGKIVDVESAMRFVRRGNTEGYLGDHAT